MTTTKTSRLLQIVLVGVVASCLPVWADEVVQFTNGAEMTVRSHVVEKDMVKLDLGSNNFISFPIAMVNRIVASGQDVFRNPVYFPSNQALPAAPGNATPVARSQGVSTNDGSTTQFPAPVGLSRQNAGPGRTGARLGEAADGFSGGFGTAQLNRNPKDDMATAERPRLDPLRQLPVGSLATIDPPQSLRHGNAPQMAARVQPAAPAPANGQNGQGSGDTGATNEPPAPNPGDDGGSEPPQDPPPNR